MPSKSQAQRRLFAIVVAYKKGKLPNANDKIKKIARGISLKDAQDFAKSIKKQQQQKIINSESNIKQLTCKIKQNIIKQLNKYIKK